MFFKADLLMSNVYGELKPLITGVKVARESEAKFKAQGDEIERLRLEVAELRGRLEELKSQAPAIRRAA
jgi:hypothetical protein